MKTHLQHSSFVNSAINLMIVLLISFSGNAQTYTTKANGAWNSASTWVGGVVPNAANIPATAIINIQHSVTYSGSNIVNNGTINIYNPAGIMPKLTVASGVNFTNNAGASLIVNGAEFVQYIFVGGGQSGTYQSGNFVNNGIVQVLYSYVEVAQNWSNQNTGIASFKNSSLVIGQSYQTNNTSIDTLFNSSASVGWQGNGNFQEGGASVYFQGFRAEIAANGGNFTINNNVIANGEIDYITLTNDFTNVAGNGTITFNKNIVTNGLTLQAYCIGNSSNYQPNGMVLGPQALACSSNYFPAVILGTGVSSRMNFSSNPVLTSGIEKQVGAKYLYQGVAPGVDVTVSIDSIVNGAVINVLDDNTGANGGFMEAFQPQITSGPNVGKSYAVFTFKYLIAGTSVPYSLNVFNLTAIDIDGSSSLSEFDDINAGLGSSAYYVSNTPAISLSQVSPGEFLGIDTDGVDKTGVDTTALVNMFTVNNTNVSGFTTKMGILTKTPQKTLRLFSLYTKGFNYPDLGTMPVKLVSFDAVLNNNNQVKVTWTTSSEQNLNHFIVERSTDGNNFSYAGIVFSSEGNSNQTINYSFNDDISKVQAGILYYRLCSVDIDGKMQYSDIRVIKVEDQTNNTLSIMAYPNPTTGALNITIPFSWQSKQVNYEIYNVSGQLSMKLLNENGSQTQTLNVSKLIPGLYIVKVSCDKQSLTGKIFKN